MFRWGYPLPSTLVVVLREIGLIYEDTVGWNICSRKSRYGVYTVNNVEVVLESPGKIKKKKEAADTPGNPNKII